MKSLSSLLLIVCVALCIGVVITDHQSLPDRIASHFDGSGSPNGWMGKTAFTVSAIAIGVAIPAFVIGIMYSIRFFPAKFLNVPNAAYWHDAANYGRACDFLFVLSLWFGSAFLVWQTFLFHTIVVANRATPPHLDNGTVLFLTIPLLVFTLGWVVVLVMRFLRTD